MIDNASTPTFNRPISLGSMCPVAGNLGRHYGIRYTCPFDWILTPLAGLIDFLNDANPDLLFRESDLSVENAWATQTVFNARYRAHLSHQFSTDEHHNVAPTWKDHIQQRMQIFRRIWEYFTSLDTAENRIVFFRMPHDLGNL